MTATVDHDHLCAVSTGGRLLTTPVRITAAGPLPGHQLRDNYARHLEEFGPMPSTRGTGGASLHDRVRTWGLTGRGGGHFPVAVKWDAAVAELRSRGAQPAPSRGAVVINAAEGEPASGKDAALLLLRPHLVLDGAIALATYLGLDEVIVWLHADPATTGRRRRDRHAVDAVPGLVRASIDGALGDRKMFTGSRASSETAPRIRVVLAPAAYTSGESSAVIRAVQPTLMGEKPGVAAPQYVLDPSRPWGDGPVVVVHNTETLARVALLARGFDEHTSLLTVSTQDGEGITRTVVEVACETPLAEVIAVTGAVTGPVLLGGYGGTWVHPERLHHLTADPAALRAEGLSLGAGVVFVAPSDQPLMRTVARLTDYLAGQSARQCGPCMFGLPALAEAVGTQARTGRNETGVRRLIELVEGRGGCRHPDGVARMVRSALDLVKS